MQADAVLADDGAAADQLPYGPVRRVPLADVVVEHGNRVVAG